MFEGDCEGGNGGILKGGKDQDATGHRAKNLGFNLEAMRRH